MANTVYMSKTGLIGGEATKLDSIDGAGLVDGDAAFVNVANVQYIYRLDADSAAVEASPNIIAPDTNAGDKRWILQSTLSPAPDIGAATGTSLTLSGLTASLPVFTDGSKKLVSNTKTGTGKVVMDTSPTLVTPTLGVASATILNISHTPHTTNYGLSSLSSGSLANNKLAMIGVMGGSNGFTVTQNESQTMVYAFTGGTGTGVTGGIVNMPGTVNMHGTVNMGGLTASLPVFTDGSKNLVSKSVADTLTALGVGVGSCAFDYHITPSQANVTGDGTAYDIRDPIWTKSYEVGSSFSAGRFTSPANGWYMFHGLIALTNVGAGHTSGSIYLYYENRMIYWGNPAAIAASGKAYIDFSFLSYMASGKVLDVVVTVSGSTKTVGLSDATRLAGIRLV